MMMMTRKKWEEKQLYGHFKQLINNISHKKTWTRLRKGNFKRETESLLIAAQNNAIRTNQIKARIDKMQQNSKCRHCIVWNWFTAKTILILKRFCFKMMQSGGKWNRVLKDWTEVCHQIFGGWEVQTMRHLQKNVWCEQRSMLATTNLNWKTLHWEKTGWLSRKKKK